MSFLVRRHQEQETLPLSHASSPYTRLTAQIWCEKICWQATRGQREACSRKTPSPVLLAAAWTQLRAQGSHPAQKLLISITSKSSSSLQAFWIPSVDLFTLPHCTCCLKPSALGTEGFFTPSISLSCLICGQEVRHQPQHQPVTQSSSKALRLATADKGLRAGAKSQEGGHWLHPSHPMEHPRH